jgi:predicted DCC family thiol-disulfide oxidoreductase YuxK
MKAIIDERRDPQTALDSETVALVRVSLVSKRGDARGDRLYDPIRNDVMTLLPRRQQIMHEDSPKTSNRLTVYFDGACPVCSREVEMYDRADRACSIQWHDVSADAGDLGRDGVSQADALARMHARLPDGRLVTGVQAFIAIWERVPGFKLFAPIARWAPARWLLERGYDWYAPRRQRLTGRLRKA